jgi:hypothetical protein
VVPTRQQAGGAADLEDVERCRDAVRRGSANPHTSTGRATDLVRLHAALDAAHELARGSSATTDKNTSVMSWPSQ